MCLKRLVFLLEMIQAKLNDDDDEDDDDLPVVLMQFYSYLHHLPGVSADLDPPPRFGPPQSKSVSGFGPPSADLDPRKN